MTDGIYLLLGSNLGDRRKMITAAEKLIDKSVGDLVKFSGIYETDAWGKTSQPPFLNQVIQITSKLSPKNLLTALLQIEDKLGRKRYEKWGERVIDIDILYYGDLIFHDKHLSVPHPEISSRRFTLIPLVEIAANFVHPVLKKSNRKLLKECKDELQVKSYKSSDLEIK